MTKAKSFDCVRMKEETHARLDKESRGLTDRQIREKIRRKPATSDNDAARWWRAMLAETTADNKAAAHASWPRRHSRRK